jgi:hypothetical protein
MKPVTVTIDTNAWIQWRAKKGCYPQIEQILRWQQEGKVQIYVSNRLRDPDTWDMYADQRDEILNALAKMGVQTIRSTFRLGISKLGGRDVLSGGATDRTSEEFEKFRKLVGPEPTTLKAEQVGSRMSNKIADFDALRDHFGAKFDVFLTLDKREYLDIKKRGDYFKELGLLIQSPEEFVNAWASTFNLES